MKKVLSLTVSLLVLFVLSACSGGGGGSAPANDQGNTAGEYSVAYTVRNTAPVSACANGGISVDAGIDKNGNGVLDPSEVTSTQYVCNGSNGTSGANGTGGTNGTNGFNALVTMTAEPGGVQCSNGGKKVSVGLDTNSNGILDTLEITSSDYICNGSIGSNGTNGTNSLMAVVSQPSGTICANSGLKITSGLDSNANNMLDPGEVTTTTFVCNGVNGTNGANGLATLVSIVSEPVGTNCQYGGQMVTAGPDNNNNGVLDSSEVTSAKYVCNGTTGPTGPAGPGITWLDVTTSITATSNMGYMADSVSRVAITLPPAPTVGDVVQVSGAGTGGWNIGQNAGQSIITKNLPNIGAVWTARDSARAWKSVASSSDGTRLVAVVNWGQIYTSTDSGVTWTARDSARSWQSVASSSDGTRLVAVANGDQIYTSTDSGVTWTARDSGRSWYSVASSSDGTKLVAVVSGGQIYTSTDSGVTWTARDSARSWQSVASSSDGTRLVAVEYGGQIYISADSGLTWTARDSARIWLSVASSSDGIKLVAGVFGGQIYTSADSGVTWTARDSARVWRSVASSSDGTRLVAVEYSGQIYISADSGVTWTARDSARIWLSVASSSDGTRLVAVEYSGQIYTSIPSAVQSTTVGTAGSISGEQYAAIELQYIGNNTFTVLSNEGYLTVK